MTNAAERASNATWDWDTSRGLTVNIEANGGIVPTQQRPCYMINAPKATLMCDGTITIQTSMNRRAAAQQRARRRERIFRRVCGTLSGLSFLALLGFVGGVEQDTIALLPGTLYMFGSLGAFALFGWLAGVFE